MGVTNVVIGVSAVCSVVCSVVCAWMSIWWGKGFFKGLYLLNQRVWGEVLKIKKIPLGELYSFHSGHFFPNPLV